MIPMMNGRSRPVAGPLAMRGAWPSYLAVRRRMLENYQRSLERRAAIVGDRARRSRSSSTRQAWSARHAPAPEMIDARARDVELPGGQRLYVHELAGPPGATTIVLLHGWGGTAAGNWATAMPTLAGDFRVVAPNLRGHDAASVDDVVALVDALDIERFVAVGYSLGSAVAAQLARRHPDRVTGLVLCAAAGVSTGPAGTPSSLSDIPTAVVVTRQDRLIPAWRQEELARSIPGATVHSVDGNHFAFALTDRFVPTLLEACHSVTRRAGDVDTNL